MYAIKGTTAAMRCLGFKYELGKTYRKRKDPIVCEQGFHACLNPYDVVHYYENNGRNRYFLVDLGGIITHCDGGYTDVAANEITFIKEVSVDDFPALFEEFIKDKERIGNLDYDDGFALIQKDNKWNYLDHDGKILCKKWFDNLDIFSDGFAPVKKNGKWRFIDRNGKYIFKEWFEEAYPFYQGVAWVVKNDKWYRLYTDGRLVLD